MEPTYFGSKDNPLFGVYHAPLNQNTQPSAVLICYPTFQEYIRSHRALKYLSDKLSKSGCHVFRFDYMCTGDSSGELTDANIDVWKKNITEAAEELRELSGINNISVVSLRMGGLLTSISGLKNIDKLIMWDSVLDGDAYLSSLLMMHKDMLSDLDRFPVVRKDKPIKGFTELLGFTLPDELFNDIKATKFSNDIVSSAKNISFICSEEDNSIKIYSNEFSESGLSVEYQVIEDDGDWLDLSRIEETLIPNKIINHIMEKFQ